MRPNPLLVEGQMQGGVMQGLGQVLLEQAVYDSDGQLVTGGVTVTVHLIGKVELNALSP